MKKTVFTLLIFIAASFAFAEDAPRISFDKIVHDFGRVIQGKTVEYTFNFKNIGTGDLRIKEVTTSCGCTAALISKNVLKEGEAGQIKVSYDSQGRAGVVSRTITVVSNDPVEPIKELQILASVDSSMHTAFNVNESIFSEKCAACHYSPAIGKHGKELYDAVCAFCHGRTASSLDQMRNVPEDRIDHVIQKGIIGTEMPAWLKELDGPLDTDQIISLISYIKGHSE